MKVVIAGSREITQYSFLLNAIEESGYDITEVCCGKARGADTLGETWAIGRDIPVKYFPADWNRYGKAAGPIRNAEMAKYADTAIVLWDGKSTGARGMIECMRKLNKPCYTYIVFLETPNATS